MLAEYNAGFKQDMRRFLKSDEGMISGAEFMCEGIRALLELSIIWQIRMGYAV